MEAILDRGIAPALVMADRDCRGLEVAGARGVERVLLDRQAFLDDRRKLRRRDYSDAVLEKLHRSKVDFVALAGFGTILEGLVLEEFDGLMVNTHPSLLPSFPGWHSVEQAIASGVKVTGTTVHLVVPAVDAGPIIAQEPVWVRSGDDVDSLHDRIKAVERWLYPSVIATAERHALDHAKWWLTDDFQQELEQEVQRCRP